MTQWIRAWLRRWRAEAAERRTFASAKAELHAMADAQLDDLGIARAEIDDYLLGRLKRHAPPAPALVRPRLQLVWSQPEPSGDPCCEPSSICCPDRRAA